MNRKISIEVHAYRDRSRINECADGPSESCIVERPLIQIPEVLFGDLDDGDALVGLRLAEGSDECVVRGEFDPLEPSQVSSDHHPEKRDQASYDGWSDSGFPKGQRARTKRTHELREVMIRTARQQALALARPSHHVTGPSPVLPRPRQ